MINIYVKIFYYNKNLLVVVVGGFNSLYYSENKSKFEKFCDIDLILWFLTYFFTT